MAAPKRPTHVVTHPSLYLRVDGKLQEIEVGTQLTLDNKISANLIKRKFVEKIGKSKEVGEKDDEK